MDDLRNIIRPVRQKFGFNLSGGILFSDEFVRVVPQKRLVCRGVWAGQPVYAKIFIGKNAKYYALRDKAGVEALQSTGIQTPALLLFSELETGGAYVLIYAEIDHAQNAEEVWNMLDEQTRISLMQKLVTAVAQHHGADLLQTDLYFKNFLVQKRQNQEDLIYTLDGDGIRHLSSWFQQRQKLINLATLFSKMDVLNDVWIPELYVHYCSQLGIKDSHQDKVMRLTQKIRHQVTTVYADKKVFRNCTDVTVRKSFGQYTAISSHFGADNTLLESPDQFLLDAKLNIKNGNTCTIGKVTISNRCVVIKRYNIKSFWHGLSRAFRPSRAAKSWANAHRLIISNIATPKPLALIEERYGWLRRRAYFLSEYVDAPDVKQFFAESDSQEDKQVAASNLAILFYKLYLLKISHGDCKASNIKIVNLKPVLIDLDGLRDYVGPMSGGWIFERKYIGDLKRLMQNWDGDAEITGLLKTAFETEFNMRNPDVANRILFRAGIAQTKVK